MAYVEYAGYFIARGAFNALLYYNVSDPGVIAAFGGNYRVAVAYAPPVIRVQGRNFFPKISSQITIDRLGEYGTKVNIIGESYA